MRGSKQVVIPAALCIGTFFAVAPVPAACASPTEQLWTLQRSIHRALDVAPEIRMAEAGIQARQGEIKRAAEWPNPSISMRVEDNIPRQLLGRGYTLDQFTISQPIPLWRLGLEKRAARQGMLGEKALASRIRLNIEARAANLFLSLQLSHEKLRLAEQRLKVTRDLVQALQHTADPAGIVRYVNPLDRARLQLLEEEADQDTAAARHSYQESLELFRNYLSLPSDSDVRLSSMRPAEAPVPLPELERRLDAQAVQLQQLRHQLEAARTGVDLQRARRFDDPVLTYIRERNVAVNNQPFTFNGIMLSVSLPLWDQNSGNIQKAQAEVMRTESRIEVARRELSSQLHQDHMQLTHLLDQSQHFRRGILQPAERFLDAVQRNYRVGASNSLALIDAYNTYFNARSRYQDLLFRGQQKALDLKQLLGQSLISRAVAMEAR